MTLPNERSRAVKQAREFMRDLLDPSKTPRVPKEIRTRAYWVLRHFPWETDMDESAKKLPELWGKD